MIETPDLRLSVRGLRVHFPAAGGLVRAVDGVTFDVPGGRTVGLVGESGCGKSVTAYSILGLVAPPGRVVAGEIVFAGRDLLRLGSEELRRVRGREIAMVYQEPMAALNPVMTAGDQVAEVLVTHEGMGWREARQRAVELLDRVQVAAPAARSRQYPHELSGGMRQRVVIAMALACSPRLLIADEPTTSLDVTVEAEVLELFRSLQAGLGMSVVLITHDLAVVADVVDEVVVLYAGKVVERAAVRELFARPLHPYTRGLLELRRAPGTPRGSRRRVIGGSVPDPIALPSGCTFHPRCPRAVPRCREVAPELREPAPGHAVACDVLE